MTMPKPITGDEFGDLLRTFRRSAFRLEVQPSYAMSYERSDFEAFLAGDLRPPDAADWFKPWLEQVARLSSEGKRISRVRVVAEPPTDYQRWERWVGQWNVRAGEDIRYLSRSTAERIGLPLLIDWWLLDDSRAVAMRYSGTGEFESADLVTDHGAINMYLEWRDLAVRNATPAEEYAAA